jgi:hypothetical protein
MNNIKVLGDGSQPEHHSHVSKSKPITLRKKELAENPASDFEKQSANLRRQKKSL